MILDDIKIITLDDISNWIHNKGLSIFDYLIKVILALVVYYIFSKLLKALINKIQGRLDKKGLDPIVSHFILNLVKYGILVFAVFTIITQLHIVEAASIAALIASAGVGITLAMQGALSNFAGGVLLLIIRPFKKGDYIIIPNANVEGVVEIIEIYYTTIRTIYGEAIKIPNSQLTNNSVINKFGEGKRALNINVDVAYDTDIDKAKGILKAILDNEPSISHDNISIYVDDLGAHGVSLGLFTMIQVENYLSIKRKLNEEILKVFRVNNIEIPYNKLDVNITNK